MKIKKELYKHYKGKIYKVIGIAHHSETLEEFVVYEGQYNDQTFGEKPLWIRPKKMFEETIKRGGKEVKRFALIKN